MKKLILFVIILIGLSSCYEYIKPIENPEEKTTISIQNLPKDTVLVSIEGETLYVFDQKTNLLKYKIENAEEDCVPIHGVAIFGFILLFLLFFIILISQ